MRDWRMISYVFIQFNFKLFLVAQDLICDTSSAHVTVLTAGTTRQVSSANFSILLVSCTGHKLAAGAMAEPWMTLNVMLANK